MADTDKLPPLVAATACLAQALDQMAPANRGELYSTFVGLGLMGLAQERGPQHASEIAQHCANVLALKSGPTATEH